MTENQPTQAFTVWAKKLREESEPCDEQPTLPVWRKTFEASRRPPKDKPTLVIRMTARFGNGNY
jgi:hypothetical protein